MKFPLVDDPGTEALVNTVVIFLMVMGAALAIGWRQRRRWWVIGVLGLAVASLLSWHFTDFQTAVFIQPGSIVVLYARSEGQRFQIGQVESVTEVPARGGGTRLQIKTRGGYSYSLPPQADPERGRLGELIADSLGLTLTPNSSTGLKRWEAATTP